ncbi:hypothetical protein ACQCT6_02730 [Cytobacillus gottheilii]|uniref:Permease n=1 Tax=Cytobacillus gottheilii TaxID=859144 RepID=A0ABX8FBA6_9BACI|nr:hypothetical protein [Cytobacillus gottheilii]QVY60447.1 hypothetical protein J1899_15695 [Cytobacillus gottheilii]
MKNFIVRNLITLIITSIILTAFMLLGFWEGNEDFFLTLLVLFSYTTLFIFLYGVISSIVAELLTILFWKGKRKVVKVLVYLGSLAIFSYSAPNIVYVFYAFIMAIFYFILDEVFRK